MFALHVELDAFRDEILEWHHSEFRNENLLNGDGPLQLIRMQPLQRYVPPRPLIARQLAEPDVVLSHKLGEFNVRYSVTTFQC